MSNLTPANIDEGLISGFAATVVLSGRPPGKSLA